MKKIILVAIITVFMVISLGCSVPKDHQQEITVNGLLESVKRGNIEKVTFVMPADEENSLKYYSQFIRGEETDFGLMFFIYATSRGGKNFIVVTGGGLGPMIILDGKDFSWMQSYLIENKIEVTLLPTVSR